MTSEESQSLRRSSRERKQVASIYSDAEKALKAKEEASPKPSGRGRKKDEEAESDDESDEMEESETDEEEEEEDSEAEGEAETKKRKRTPTKSKAVKAPTKKSRKVMIQVGGSKRKSTARTPRRKGKAGLLAVLSKKVLEENETEESSLFAALFGAGKSAPGTKKASDYASGLQLLARRLIQEYEEDANKVQVDLVNLLFRSVGGTVSSMLDPSTVFEEMDSEDWAESITDLVDDMRYTVQDAIAICADPKGALHSASLEKGEQPKSSNASLALAEYRKLYEEFWYVLAKTALEEGEAGLQGEIPRELIMRMNEIVTAGQPDIRAAAVVSTYQMGQAAVDHTAYLGDKLEVARRQLRAASKQRSKAENLKTQIDSIQRTRSELEELVKGLVLDSVFSLRYRDSNSHTRAYSLQALSKMTLTRPDLFLVDKYLKYFAWLLSDKEATVRRMAVRGLAAPFLAVAENDMRRSSKIDLDKMNNVINKFLPRLADCVLDKDSLVQEGAMSLLLTLAQEGFFDQVEDDDMWNQINLRAIAETATPNVRRDALYFIMEQLEAFDDGGMDQDLNAQKKWSRDKNVSLSASREREAVRRLDAIASWVAHVLTDSAIPMDSIRIHLSNFIVDSLRAMPEHNSILSWSTLLRAIDTESSANFRGDRATDRAEVAKQRVLIQMLSYSVQAEVASISDSPFLSQDADPDDTEEMRRSGAEQKPKRNNKPKGTSHELLSVTILKALPNLLVKFKSDTLILKSLCILPRYLLPSAVSLPQRKKDFVSLVKKLAEIYVQVSDEELLENIAQSLTFLASGDHSRAKDAELQLKQMTSDLAERLGGLFASEPNDDKSLPKPKKFGRSRSSSRKRSNQSEKSDSSARSTKEDEDEDETEVSSRKFWEHSIFLCLKRLKVLSYRTDVGSLLPDEEGDSSMESVRAGIVDGIGSRLKAREVEREFGKEDDETVRTVATIPKIWTSEEHASIHTVIAESVKEALGFLLATTGWELNRAMRDEKKGEGGEDKKGEDDEGEVEDFSDHKVVRYRQQLEKLLVLCYEQWLPGLEDDSSQEYSEEHLEFSDRVQLIASQVQSDLRTLFPKDWIDADSPLLRACALEDDTNLVGGFLRYFQAKEDFLRENEDNEEDGDEEGVMEMLLPFVRNLYVNWTRCNRREAGRALMHLMGSGPEAKKILTALAKQVKKLDPVRWLEVHMACLQTAFEEYLDMEPEEISDNPTDEECAAFEEAEAAHIAKFATLESLATKLSQSLGVGKLSDRKLEKPLPAFMSQGVLFSFSTETPDGQEDFLPGGRLMFLSLMAKYSTWIKSNVAFRKQLWQDVAAREAKLRADPDFDPASDDIEALENFKNCIVMKGFLKKTKKSSPAKADTISSEEGSLDGEGEASGTARTPSSRRSVSSRGNSVGTYASVVSALSPLVEEPDSSDSDESPTKRRKISRVSVDSNITMPTIGGMSKAKTQDTIEEEGSEMGDDLSD